jgi:UDP-N-acetylglucosamine:LPS N-acetylglucosamine transferase
MKIIFSGGGTLGPVTPLLAVAAAYKQAHPDAEFIWVGTKFGPERQVVEEAGLTFYPLNGGKWRRYLSFWNIVNNIETGITMRRGECLIYCPKNLYIRVRRGFLK